MDNYLLLKMIKFNDFEIHERLPSVIEFMKLRAAVSWRIPTNQDVRESLLCSPYCVSAYHLDEIVGMVRITGDKTMYGYVQDFMVIPEYQGRGVGTKMLELLLSKIDKNGYLIGVCPSKGSTKIYQSFGFEKRPESPNGFMSKVVQDV